ncbi:MAG: OmpA family protein [Deferribacteraceae bacterium]|jgi:hypothetical protein|nr:OmpA family protein [Deferribacteraceae bacterium]
MYVFYSINLNLIILLSLAVLTIGGVNLSIAAKRNIYEITAENNTSKVTTLFQVYAENERDAKENIALNGWKILSIRQVTFRQNTGAVPIQVDDDPVMFMRTASPSGDKTGVSSSLSDEDIINSLLGSSVQNASLTPKDAPPPMRGNADILSITPDSDLLEYLYTIYFNFSIVTPVMNKTDNEAIAKLPKDGTYYLFGHADNVSVTENTMFKDNYELSFKRAEAVKKIMDENGINSAKLITVGLGALYPAVKNNSSADGTLQNRRVEIYGLRTTK